MIMAMNIVRMMTVNGNNNGLAIEKNRGKKTNGDEHVDNNDHSGMTIILPNANDEDEDDDDYVKKYDQDYVEKFILM